MCGPGVRSDNTVSTGTMISSLKEKSQDSNAFTNEALLELAKELLASFSEREQEWSAAGNWVIEEVKTLKLHPESKPIEEIDDYAYTQAASVRATFSSGVGSYLTSIVKSLENQVKKDSGSSQVELIKKKRTIETSEGSVEVHGPVGLPMIPGISFETWSKPSNVDYQGFMDMKNKGGVCLVLGAGNQPLLSAVDTLHCIFSLRSPVLLKHHPVRPYLIHPYGVIFQPLIEKGLLKQILDEGIPKTRELLSNQTISHVHITGAYQTVAAIQKTLVETRSDVKDMKDAEAMVTSELGCATPFIFSPAVYAEKELRNAAKAFVTSKKYNGGSNCLCGQVIVMPKEWPQNQQFREILLEEITTTQKDPVYYPGSLKKRDSALSAYSSNDEKESESNSGSGRRRRSSVLSAAPTVDAMQDDDVVLVECGTPGEDDFNGYSLQEEAFGPVVAMVELQGGGEGTDPVKYMEETVAPFVNDKEKIFGTLSCTLLWPESIRTTKKPQEDEGLIKAVATLQYGTVAVNSWSVFGYLAALSGGVWGGHPRDALRHSGSGFVGNHFDLPVEKQVIYGTPLTSSPLLDKKNVPPAIVHDVLHAVTISNSKMGALLSVWMVLVARSLQFCLPRFLTKPVFGERRYGAAL